ncbi:MAG: phosphate ABC transporter substrate-binding/OmpA family protein [Rhodobacteraceae bacterium]|nr:phosphate ABC transporter substrate-binding/OmpA family protein [Paracoccaceae bacterium]
MGIVLRAAALALGLAAAAAIAPAATRAEDASAARPGAAVPHGGLTVAAAEPRCQAAACPPPAAPAGPAARFAIHGARTAGTTLVPELLRGYAESLGGSLEIAETGDPARRIVRIHGPDGALRAEIDLSTPGSAEGLAALAAGAADIAVTDRPMTEADRETLARAGLPDLRGTPAEALLATDALVVITNARNPVRDISAEELARIYAGEITNWRALGGGDVPIAVNSYAEGSDERALFLDRLVRPTGREEAGRVARWPGFQALVNAVMADPGGIGYVGRWLAAANPVTILPLREVCGLHSEPSDFRLRIGAYPLARGVFAYTRPGDLHPEARAFLDWALGEAAQPWVRRARFADRSLARMRLEDMGQALIHTAAVEPDFDGDQFSALARELRGADRLSLSFRFRASGSTRLDDASLRNAEELARLIEADAFSGFEVLLVGFADSVGPRDENTRLAQARANRVREIIARALGPAARARTPLVALSFGELLPLSCNEDESGRERNRRVEVWLRLPGPRNTRR